MQRCRYTQDCPFFRNEMPDAPGISSVLRRHYCHDHHASCARFRVAAALGMRAVPADMLPSQLTRVTAVLGAQHRAS